MSANCTIITQYTNVTTGTAQERHVTVQGNFSDSLQASMTDAGTEHPLVAWVRFHPWFLFIALVLSGFVFPIVATYVVRINELRGRTAMVNMWRVSKGYEPFSFQEVYDHWSRGKTLFALKRHLDIIRRKHIGRDLEVAAMYLTDLETQGSSMFIYFPSCIFVDKASIQGILHKEYREWERDNDKRRRSQHIYAEILYDVIQTAVMAWVMSEVELKDKHFPFKLLLDFLNMATTCGDLFLLKGPQAFDIVLETAGAEGGLGKALLAELRAYGSDGERDMYSTVTEGLKAKIGDVRYSKWMNQQYRGSCLAATLLPGLDQWIRFTLFQAEENNLETEEIEHLRGSCLAATLLPGLDQWIRRQWIRFTLFQAAENNPETEHLNEPMDP